MLDDRRFQQWGAFRVWIWLGVVGVALEWRRPPLREDDRRLKTVRTYRLWYSRRQTHGAPERDWLHSQEPLIGEKRLRPPNFKREASTGETHRHRHRIRHHPRHGRQRRRIHSNRGWHCLASWAILGLLPADIVGTTEQRLSAQAACAGFWLFPVCFCFHCHAGLSKAPLLFWWGSNGAIMPLFPATRRVVARPRVPRVRSPWMGMIALPWLTYAYGHLEMWVTRRWSASGESSVPIADLRWKSNRGLKAARWATMYRIGVADVSGSSRVILRGA